MIEKSFIESIDFFSRNFDLLPPNRIKSHTCVGILATFSLPTCLQDAVVYLLRQKYI